MFFLLMCFQEKQNYLTLEKIEFSKYLYNFWMFFFSDNAQKTEVQAALWS